MVTKVYKHTLRIVIAFPLQHWLHKEDSMLRYTQVACLLFFVVVAHRFYMLLQLEEPMDEAWKFKKKNIFRVLVKKDKIMPSYFVIL
jgi:hypothetical protein